MGIRLRDIRSILESAVIYVRRNMTADGEDSTDGHPASGYPFNPEIRCHISRRRIQRMAVRLRDIRLIPKSAVILSSRRIKRTCPPKYDSGYED